MAPPRFEDWTIDMVQQRAQHHTGFSVQVEGDPKDPSGVVPGRAPEHLSAVEQAQLLREGMDVLAASAASVGRSGPRIKSRSQQRAEAQAKLFAEREDKLERPRLSLKKTTG